MSEPTYFRIFIDGRLAHDGFFHSHDHAKMQLRRMQREMNRSGYSPESERLTIQEQPS